MAQNVTLMGASYPDVPSIVLPKTGGGTASFTDVSNTTATAEKVIGGSKFFNSSGVLTNGTAELGMRVLFADHMVGDKWVRPSEYPDLDSIQIANDEHVIYLTYDLRKALGWAWIGIYGLTVSGVNYYVERGHLSGTTFVVDESYTKSSDTTFKQDLDINNGEIQLWRVRANSNLRRVGFVTNPSAKIYNMLQPCVEKRGNMPACTSLYSYGISTSSSGSCIGTVFLEREKMRYPSTTNVTSLSYTYARCMSLQEIDMSEWDTSNWAVTTLYCTFANCFSLYKLDFSSWDTTNWVVTNMQNTFSSTRRIKSLDFSHWDTSDWAVTTLESCFDGSSIQKLDLSHWDVSNWAVTTLKAFAYSAYLLETIDVTGWDTSNWAVTTMYAMFCYDWVLHSVDLSNLDVSNWAVTDTTSCFSSTTTLHDLSLPAGLKFPTANSFNTMYTLTNFSGVKTDANQDFSVNYMLSTTSLLNIIDRLMTVSSTKTLTLGMGHKSKLTDAQIAVATQKGWTVA